ncbi:queuine tRNA-ribosyltransferase accessory subunit 2 isoform X2 [Alligator mississippiensis]|uniref:Queuine tRNA-ribosyltransferase accessory subunit 2 n=1 Tax=Alligator mississippiensis TaxID=8496 RepID=A0A151MCY7_ALLMI|nr:queuine tRNA-ribosyltransferase accessory subunit 2 isoform X2 [Alligator mississippiensis]KYO22396.1 queuine tRNA-ribosyltransferase subunit QTRTD1 [Alligator mississippiensis]
MKLNLSKVVNGCRLGKLTNLGKEGAEVLEFPGCLLYTKTGSPPHLTHDTLQAIKGVPTVAQITLSTLVELHEVLEEYKEGIGKFIGMPDSVLYCSVQDPATSCPSGYNTNTTVSIWGCGGRMQMTAFKFMSMQQALKPNWFQCLSDGDTASGETSRKRAKKSVDRSLSFLDKCLELLEKSPELQESVLIGVIEGGDVLEERLRSARETAKRAVGGFLLDGFQGHAMAKETKLRLMDSVTAELPEDKPRLIHGIGKPDEVLECIERGVDIFESAFPYQVTERGCALSFSYDYQPDPEAAVLKQNWTKDAGGNGSKKDKDETSKADLEMTSFEIFLKDKRYQDDFGPLVQGCSCYCCQNHSRAYVHHLLVTNELLAGVLLMMHNFQHYFSFFGAIRDALRDERLNQLKKVISKQALNSPLY